MKPYQSPPDADRRYSYPLDLSGVLPDFEDGVWQDRALVFSLSLDDHIEAEALAAERPRATIASLLTGVGIVVGLVGLAVAAATLDLEVQTLTIIVALLGAAGALAARMQLQYELMFGLVPRAPQGTPAERLRERLRTEFLAKSPVDQQTILGPRTIQVTPAAIELRTLQRLWRREWSGFQELFGYEQYGLLFPSGDEFILFPRHAFRDEADYVDFLLRAAGQIRKSGGLR